MIKVKVKFGVSTKYLRSGVEEEVEIEVYPEDDMDEDAIEGLIQEEIEEAYNEWVWKNINTWNTEISREVVEDE